MAPVTKTDGSKEYDFFVIGGGSGGLAGARRAATHGAKVGLVEATHRLGGTCVNVGCVPKKICWHTAELAQSFHKAVEYGFGDEKLASQMKNSFNWNTFKLKRDAFIKRLNGIYESNLLKDNVEEHQGHASFVDANTIEIKKHDGSTYNVTAKKILVAVGGRPTIPDEKTIPGAQYGITSDGFFELESQPKRVAVVGAGYIAVELAGIFNSLGTESHLIIRRDKVLRTFDPMVQDIITEHMEHTGMNIHKSSNVKKVEKTSSGSLLVHVDSLSSPLEVDVLLWAIGRQANTDTMKADKAGLKMNEKNGEVIVDDYQSTNVPHIFAVGDVTGRVQLTPVAIAAGRRLSNRLFGGDKYKNEMLSYEGIPSVVFSHPTIGAVGLTEPQAREKYGDDVKIYKSKFNGLSVAVLDPEDKVSTSYKIVCTGEDEKVVGIHLIGEGSDEVLQGFGVAMKMGATKEDLDSCVAIHPTSAEELVTMR